MVPNLSADQRLAGLTFQISEGQQTIIDHILIVGNTRTDERVIKRELLIEEGKPLGLEDVAESQRRLGALGLFRRFRIEELAHGRSGNKDVLVTVEEAAARTFSYGGGAEVTRRLFTALGGPQERLDLGPRGFVDFGFRNIGGRNRSLDLYSRGSRCTRKRPRPAPRASPVSASASTASSARYASREPSASTRISPSPPRSSRGSDRPSTSRARA